MNSPHFASSTAAAPARARSVIPEAGREGAITANNSTRTSGYGLPCARCHTYYLASLESCPVCKSGERLLPPDEIPVRAHVPVGPVTQTETLEMLREASALAYVAPLETGPEGARCSNSQNHPGESEPAAVCKSCYTQLQQQADLMEAALHMDVKEATQLIYDAVWADPSDPSKTYQNAAQAVLSEMRRRAGFSAVLGRLQPKPH